MCNFFKPSFSTPRQWPWSVTTLLGVILATTACTAEPPPAPLNVPPQLSAALGWQPLPERDYRPYQSGSVFMIGSEPSQWLQALPFAATWAQQAPDLAKKPAEFLLIKSAYIQALVLGASDKAAAAQLRIEQKALEQAARDLQETKADGDTEWQRREAARQLQELNKAIGVWLADSPAERVQAFRDEMDAYRPADRAKIAARYGGEEKLADLLKRMVELEQLNAAYAAAQQDTVMPEPQRKLAQRKAAGALGYFYGFNGEDADLQRAAQDSDVKAALGGVVEYDSHNLSVPDLVTWIGAAEAEKLLIEAFALPVDVQFAGDNRTAPLARRLLREGRLSPQRVPWSLVSWPGNELDFQAADELVVIYDVLKKQFPDLVQKKPKYSDWTRNSGLAKIAYALAVKERMAEAVELLAAAGPEATGLPYHARMTPGFAAEVWKLELQAAMGPNADKVWSRLERLAGSTDGAAELTAFAAKQADAAVAGSEAAKIWRNRQGWALIRTEKIDEGIALVRPLLALEPEPAQKAWSKEWAGALNRWLLLSRTLARPELVAEWEAKLAIQFNDAASPVWQEDDLFNSWAVQQLANGQFAALEMLLRKQIAAVRKVVADKRSVRDGGSDSWRDESRLTELTQQLADVLARAKQPAEVLTLLATSPDLKKTDLAQLLDRSSKGPWRPLALVTAEALQEVGRSEDALRVLEAYLIKNSGSDPAYELYTRFNAEKAGAFFARLWAADQYEERPLIWLASMQLAAGKVDEAEATVKRAIATDPSDGEQPKGDRMRAYAVLRAVALKKGDTAQAEFLAKVIAAIRLSEAADDLAQAGLVNRAIKDYQTALGLFSDAYCIQSRLARRLAEEGRPAEAAEHFKRAFELMPDSFGRVESHCFGCEQAFVGKEAQSIAEKVFMDLASKPDAKPQVHYLLGYLRMEQDRWEEAAGFFEKAAQRDPDYLNAWKKLAEVLPNTQRPRSEQDRVAFRLLALDPAGKHGGAETANVRDLPALWQAYTKATEPGLTVPKHVFPLGDKLPKNKGTREAGRDEFGDDDSTALETPAQRFAKQPVMRAVTQSMDAAYQWILRGQ